MTSRLCSTTTTVLPPANEPVDDAEQAVDVGRVEAGGRFVHDVDVAGAGQLGGELEALRFAAREGGQRLAEAQIADAHVDQELQAAPDAGASFRRSLPHQLE